MSASSRICRLALAACLTLVAGCGGAVDPPDTAEVIKNEPPKPTPDKPATETTPAQTPDVTPPKADPKE